MQICNTFQISNRCNDVDFDLFINFKYEKCRLYVTDATNLQFNKIYFIYLIIALLSNTIGQ